MTSSKIALFVLSVFLIAGCAEFQRLPTEVQSTVYVTQGLEGSVVERYAPVFLAYGYEEVCNRIGKPTATLDDQGREHIAVDPTQPRIYYLMRSFSTEKDTYTNLIYRIHFPEVPFSLVPFHLTAGRNVGLVVVVTLDTQERPVLVTTVHTCGCYVASVPTSFLPKDSLPVGWRDEPVEVWGEHLPARLDYGIRNTPRLLVYLRPGVHRVTNLEILDERHLLQSPSIKVVTAPLMPMGELDRLPLNGRRTSFFYQDGLREGHVKGSIKPWESLFLSRKFPQD